MSNEKSLGAGKQVRKSWKWWGLRILIVLAGSLVFLLILGFIYETIASRSDWKRYPPPGKRIDIGGFQLHLYCSGEKQGGLPTVILEAGGGNASPDWALVQPEIAKVTRVCSYDRAGRAWSDMGPLPRSSKVFATELHTLLNAAGENGPYVVVGHSYGSHTVRIFASDYPTEVAGIILVDSRMEELSSHPLFTPTRSSGQMSLWSILARFGFFRVIGKNMLPAVYQEKLPNYPLDIIFTPQFFKINELEDTEISDSDVRETDGFGDTPLIVIVHGKPAPMIYGQLDGTDLEEAERLFHSAAKNLAALSTDSQYIVAEDSGHMVPIERPDVVIEAILSLVENQ
jgi:pimeloyl-ACP methyl ester carboxylesterase